MQICQGAEEKRCRDTGAYSLYVRMVFRYDGAEGGMAFPFSGPCFCTAVYILLQPRRFRLQMMADRMNELQGLLPDPRGQQGSDFLSDRRFCRI